MRLTKINNVFHYKNIDKGELKRLENNDEQSTHKRVVKRFDEQIEARIYNEFIRYRDKKNKTVRIDKNKKFRNPDIQSVYYLIKELYSGKNFDWEPIELINFDLEKNKNCLQYKFIKKSDSDYMYKLSETEKSPHFLDMFIRFINIINANSSREELRKTNEYKILKSNFLGFKKRKIELIIKSLNNNRVTIQFENNRIISNHNKENLFIELLKECVNNYNEDILGNKLNEFSNNLINSNFLDDIKDCFKNNYDLNNLKKSNNKLKSALLDLTREYNKNNQFTGLEHIYNSEIKKYFTMNLSTAKKEKKGKKDDHQLYRNFLQKVFCIKPDGEIDKEKFIIIINERFKNQFMEHILKYGKFIHYKKDDYFKNRRAFDSSDLEFIKCKETLTRKMATLVSFAANSLYSLFDRGLVNEKFEDFLGYAKTKETITHLNKKRVNYFFDTINMNNIGEFISIVSEAIYNIRNGVGHFDNINLGKYTYKENGEKFVETFTENKDAVNSLSYSKTIIKDKLIERFLSNNLEYYYDEESLEQYFNIYQYRLVKTKLPFAPNFKRIKSKGENLYLHNNEQYKYFFNKSLESDDEKEHKRVKNFLLKELYYNNFFEEFLNSKTDFNNAVKKARLRKASNKRKKGSNGRGYDSISQYNNQDISDYIAMIHKEEINRLENDKHKEDNKKSSNLYLRDYIEDIFLEGFISWLKNKNLNFLTNAVSDKEISENKCKFDFKANIAYSEADLDQLKEDDNKLLNLFLFLKMIDNKRLMEFKNEIIKYKQFLIKKDINPKEFMGISLHKFESICELILLTAENLDNKNLEKDEEIKKIFDKFYDNTEDYEMILNKFVSEELISMDKGDKENQLYFNSDGKTPILHGNLEKTRKFSTQDFLANIIKKSTEFKYSKKDYREKEGLSEKIENLNKERDKLHEKWIKEKNKFSEDDKKSYRNICKDIRRYSYLQNKENLQNIYKLHEILSDILARNIAYINKWERDFKFMMLAIQYFSNNQNINMDIIKVLKLELSEEEISQFGLPEDEKDKFKKELKKGYFNINSYNNFIKNKNNPNSKRLKTIEYEGLVNNFIDRLFMDKETMQNKIRNYIAHLIHINKYNIDNEVTTKYNLIDIMNGLIKMFSYDKKTKNHINKSIKTILEKYNIDISFKIDDSNEIFKFHIKELNSLKGKQLGKNNKFPIHESEFILMVRELLLFKN